MTMSRRHKLATCLALMGIVGAMPAAAVSEGPSPPQPPQPLLVPAGTGVSGSFFAYPDHNVVQGGVANGGYYTFGGGASSPYTGQLLSFGNSTSSVQLQTSLSPVASAYAAATQGNTYGRSDSGMVLGYLVVLTAPDAAAAASISALLGTSGAIAHVSGGWTLTGDGYGYSSAYASTGTNALDPSLGSSAGASCGRYGVQTTAATAGCGSSSFYLDLNFVAGSTYADGNPLSFYSAVTISANAAAGIGGASFSPVPGTATAFIDPTVTLASGIQATLALGHGGDVSNYSPAAVPEPADWAMMLVGLAALGAWTRRRAG